MIRVVLADDETLLRTALAALLDMEDDIEVVGQASNGEEAVRVIEALQPDVALLDLEMPGGDGLTAASTLLIRRPERPIVLLTRHARPGVLRTALAAGVRGFVGKSIDPSALAHVVRLVHSGQRYIDAEISTAALVDDCPLTDRELEVLRVAGTGATVREIAAQVHLASGTVRNYLSAAMAKTGASTRMAAARVARERGWL